MPAARHVRPDCVSSLLRLVRWFLALDRPSACIDFTLVVLSILRLSFANNTAAAADRPLLINPQRPIFPRMAPIGFLQRLKATYSRDVGKSPCPLAPRIAP